MSPKPGRYKDAAKIHRNVNARCLLEYAAHICAMEGPHALEVSQEQSRLEGKGSGPEYKVEMDSAVEECDALLASKIRYHTDKTEEKGPSVHCCSVPEQTVPALSTSRESSCRSAEAYDDHRCSTLRQRTTGTSCSRHLTMASEYTTAFPADKTQSKAPIETPFLSNVSSLIRTCFCRGPRPFLFPGKKTCCTIRRKREPSSSYSSKSGKRVQRPTVEGITQIIPSLAPRTDIEKGGSSLKYTLSFGVVGMTCTGCESKLHNILRSQSGVSEVRTSFILNRADLVYDAAVISDPTEIARQVKKLTGFTCTILKTGLANANEDGESFHIKNLGSQGKSVVEEMGGVNRVVAIGNGIHEIFYTAERIGVRDILSAANSNGGQAVLSLDDMAEELDRKATSRHWNWLAGRTVAAGLLTVPVLVFAWAPCANLLSPPGRRRLSAASLSLATIVQLIASPIYKHAFQALLYRRDIDMDVLVVLSITMAYVYSLIAFALEVHNGKAPSALGRPIFETSSLLITLILVGRLMTLWVRHRARDVVKAGASQAKTARVVERVSPSAIAAGNPCVSWSCDSEELLDTALLHYGDIVQGSASEQIITDGIIVDGSAEIDESHVTGENDPVVRSVGSYILAGSTIINGNIKYRVTRLISENTISVTKRLVSTAASSKTKTQERADLVASYLTPTILFVACVAFLAWVLVSIFVRHWNTTRACVDALTYPIAILAISCPCALALAVPMVLTVASSVGVKRGVLFKTGIALDIGRKIKHVVFDKTGTLTTGQLTIQLENLLSQDSGFTDQEIRRMTVMATSGNRHPVSLAVKQHLEHRLPSSEQYIGTVNLVIGKGVEVITEACTIKGGSPAWLGVQDHPAVKDVVKSSLTVFCIARDDRLVAVYGLSSTIRPETTEVLKTLREMRVTLHLLSGDHPLAVSHVASELGFMDENVKSLCQPESKASYIRNLQQSTSAKVLFIGDGTNDGPALAQADLGVCMSNSTNVAAGASDVGILSGSLRGLLIFLELSKKASNRIWLNVSWALIYNLFAVLLAGGVFEAVRFRIEPSYAGMGEMVSLLPIVGISLSLNYWPLK
ncbi:MAG: hypothetical protein M1839_005625 [Geoglossum umbratile]|nr:MAG: hypothetical protein M1839_005625 [Geoglossum umbratile]